MQLRDSSWDLSASLVHGFDSVCQQDSIRSDSLQATSWSSEGGMLSPGAWRGLEVGTLEGPPGDER